jgi:hypothetical protein
MIGFKSIAAIAAAVVALGAALGTGALGPDHVQGLTAASCLAVGLFAALLTALVAPGWARLGSGGRGRELPRGAQLGLLAVAFTCIGLGAFDNEATARLVALGDDGKPSPSEYCPAEVALPAEEREPVPPPPEIQGCALVRRAFEMGYAKSLGECAPRQVEVVKKQVAKQEVCELRQLDEPFLHYSWRRLTHGAGGLADADPVGALTGKVDEIQTRLDHLDTLVASHLHSFTGSPHAAHHLWVNLPDPRPERSWVERMRGHDDCAERYDRLPVWPSTTDPAALVDHVFGQLLFDARYGEAPGTCTEYTVHWDAPPDACQQLAADPVDFLGDQGALENVRAVLDRHKRTVELRKLMEQLGHRQHLDAPPDPRALVSVQCLIVDPAGSGVGGGREVLLDGYALPVRELRTKQIVAGGSGPIALFAQMSDLLAGFSYGGPARESTLIRIAAAPPQPGDVGPADYLLARLEYVHEIDPFTGARWPLEQADLLEVYPVQVHLRSFIEAFRERYWAQRGRL